MFPVAVQAPVEYSNQNDANADLEFMVEVLELVFEYAQKLAAFFIPRS